MPADNEQQDSHNDTWHQFLQKPSISGSLCKWSNIRSVVAKNNAIEWMDFGGMDKLCYLDLSKNNIRRVQEALNGCTNIMFLSLAYNNIVKLKFFRVQNFINDFFTDELGNLSNLQYLNASNNQLITLSEFSHLHSLQIINISSNYLSSIDKVQSWRIAKCGSFIACLNLTSLNISCNHIEDVSTVINSLKGNDSLRLLDVSNNPCTCIANYKNLLSSALPCLGHDRNNRTSHMDQSELSLVKDYYECYEKFSAFFENQSDLAFCERLTMFKNVASEFRDSAVALKKFYEKDVDADGLMPCWSPKHIIPVSCQTVDGTTLSTTASTAPTLMEMTSTSSTLMYSCMKTTSNISEASFNNFSLSSASVTNKSETSTKQLTGTSATQSSSLSPPTCKIISQPNNDHIAVVKIQSLWRGYSVRKKMRMIRSDLQIDDDDDGGGGGVFMKHLTADDHFYNENEDGDDLDLAFHKYLNETSKQKNDSNRIFKDYEQYKQAWIDSENSFETGESNDFDWSNRHHDINKNRKVDSDILLLSPHSLHLRGVKSPPSFSSPPPPAGNNQPSSRSQRSSNDSRISFAGSRRVRTNRLVKNEEAANEWGFNNERSKELFLKRLRKLEKPVNRKRFELKGHRSSEVMHYTSFPIIVQTPDRSSASSSPAEKSKPSIQKLPYIIDASQRNTNFNKRSRSNSNREKTVFK
ncbi:hypothetical protein HELRODRAFT_168380 [Helobdella robusta]|uniref:Uncharacterized protein n=1 Tax=Helobdella robusta TaxID=6412 RepID=T1F0I5_HELRO|nr:hypothetical protein HELRODRAFT_168380 [Helobdella robusta]ESO09398.1 hypothetical protein HELRODRAFT_168380 [Helobdella robusta]